MLRNKNNWAIFILIALVVVICSPLATFASSSQGFEFETGLEKLANSLTGPVARSVALIGIVVGAVGAIWGAEFGHTARMLFGVILIIGILCFAGPILTNVMGVTGALI